MRDQRQSPSAGEATVPKPRGDDGSSEAAVDEAVRQSFPASDPAAPGVPSDRQREQEAEKERLAEQQIALDEALAGTFPASDPVALTQPQGEED